MPEAVEMDIFIRAPAEEVFRMFTSEESLRRWYFPNAKLEGLGQSGRVWGGNPGGGIEAVVAEIDEPRRLVWRFQDPFWGQATFEFVPEGHGTRVLLRHDGFSGRPQDTFDAFSLGWSGFLANLQAVIEGRVPPFDPKVLYRGRSAP